jgi:hypothetical protein
LTGTEEIMSRTEAPSESQEAPSNHVNAHVQGQSLVPSARTSLDGANDDLSDFDAEDHIVRGID